MQLQSLVERNKGNRNEYDIVVIGDVFYDIMTMPISDYPDKNKQLGCEFIPSIGGQGGNCAAACASLGLKTSFICKIGNDILSKWILAELQKLGSRCFAAISEEKKGYQRPGVTVSISFEDGSRAMLSDRGANNDLKIENIDFEFLRKSKFLMRAGHWNTEGLFSANKKVISFAKSIGAYTAVDMGWSAYLGWNEFARETVFGFLPFTDFFFVNEDEIKGLSGKERGGEYELIEYGCKNVIVHKGEEGSAWISNGFEISCDAFKVTPIRPTGAGDIFNAGFIYAFLSGKEAKECLKFANACAALHIKTLGSIYPKVKEVEYLYNRIS